MAILAIFSLRMRRNGYLAVSGEILTPEFDSLTPIGNDISAICRRFLLIFAFDVLNVHHTSPSGLLNLLSTDLESVLRISPLTAKICSKFEVNTTIQCLVIAFLLLIHYVTL